MGRIAKWGCGGLVVLVILAVVVVALSGGGEETTGQLSGDTSESQASESQASESQASASATDTPLPEAPAFADITSEVEDMTDAQRNNYLKNLKQHRAVEWEGSVCDVTESFGVYRVELTVDTTNDGITCTSEAQWKVTEEQALEYSKGDTVSFSGTIDDVSEVMGAFTFKLNEVAVHSRGN